jgi:YHS domain-containing protein
MTIHPTSENRSRKNKNKNKETNIMNTTKTEAKDPICGMTVDTANALHVERDGETFYFCSEHCREKFLAAPDKPKPDDKSGGCCG